MTAPKKVEIKGWIHLTPWDNFHFNTYEDMTDSGYTMVTPYTIIAEVPRDFDPTAQRIAALEKKRDALRKKFQEEIMRVNEEISKLQAIGFSTGTVIDPDDPLS